MVYTVRNSPVFTDERNVIRVVQPHRQSGRIRPNIIINRGTRKRRVGDKNRRIDRPDLYCSSTENYAILRNSTVPFID